jgi:hypothetical protein
MLGRIRCRVSSRWYAAAAYWHPRSLWWISPGGGFRRPTAHRQGVDDQLLAEVLGHAPAHDPAAAQVHHPRQVQEALALASMPTSLNTDRHPSAVQSMVDAPPTELSRSKQQSIS